MTKFNPENKETLNLAELLDPAMKITDSEDAKQFLESYTLWVWQKSPSINMEEAERIAKENLAYYAGYIDIKTRKRVEELFGAVHPILGKAEQAAVW